MLDPLGRVFNPMNDDHKTLCLFLVLTAIVLIGIIGLSVYAVRQHTKDLLIVKDAIEICTQSVESDLAKVNCLSNATGIGKIR